MAIEIVDLPIEHGDFPVRYVAVYQRVDHIGERNKHCEDLWQWGLLRSIQDVSAWQGISTMVVACCGC